MADSLRPSPKFAHDTVAWMGGDADISIPAALFGDPSRARVLLALSDGRALPASVLAAEAGVTASTVSEHLAKLCEAGMLNVERHGRHRYYRVASAQVVHALEALAQIAPQAPIRSLRQHTRARALRQSRLCYDHVAGRLGVALMRALIDSGAWMAATASTTPSARPPTGSPPPATTSTTASPTTAPPSSPSSASISMPYPRDGGR